MNLALFYKNFAANANVSHIGLGVSALNTAKVLKRHGINVRAAAICSVVELDQFLQRYPNTTHVVLAAAWIPVLDLGHIVTKYPDIEFAVNIHSNVGFLQADANGVKLLAGYIHLQRELLNFRVSGNSLKFSEWATEAYTSPTLYLPNLYDLDHVTKMNRPIYNGGTIRIGAFGATRPLKNFMTAAGAAIAISKQLRVPVEFWVNGGRTEGGGNTILKAIEAMLHCQPHITLHILNWRCWPELLDFMEGFHLMMQISYTESFNMVTADGISRGVPSVVSEAIDWAPKNWIASIDDPLEVAQVGRALITDPHAVVDGVKALEWHNRDGLHAWTDFLAVDPMHYASNILTRPIR